MDAPPVLIADRYRLVRRVGSGGMGVVWEAWDERLHRTVAVKQLHAQPGLSEAETQLAHERAMREARITARLDHPNAVPVFDVVEHDGQPCLIMQFLPSEPLSAVLRERTRLPFDEVARIGAQVASALAAAHRLGIVHRDVKPGNVLIARDGTARISDFGISHALGDVTLTSTGMVHGTPAYLAPEVARGGDSTFSSDVFGLGATLYAAVEGAPPFGVNANSIALLYKVASGEFDPPDPEGPLTPLLTRMLAPEPADRPVMGDVAHVLEGVDRPSAAPDPADAPTRVVPPIAPTTPWVKRSVPSATLPLADLPTPPATRPTVGRPAAEPAALSGSGQTGSAQASSGEAGPPDAGTPGAAGTEPPESGRPRRRLLAGLVLLVVLAGLAWLLATVIPGLRNDTAAPPVTASSAGPTRSTAASASSSPSDSPSAATTSAKPTSASPTRTSSSPSPSPTPTRTSTKPTPSPSRTSTKPTPSPSRTSDKPTTEELKDAVTSYYALMPDDTDAGWNRLTDRYQSKGAGSKRSYERFWGNMARVSVSRAEGIGSRRAEATVTYRMKNGKVSVERTRFDLVEDDGVLKIDDTKVLSSR